MALKIDTGFAGLQVLNSYVRVVSVNMVRGSGVVVVCADSFVDAEADEAFTSQAFTFPYTPDATVAWAYEQLKTLPEFAGAVDV